MLGGDPKKCSQCVGWKPRMVIRNEATGTLSIDGVPIAMSFARGAAPSRYAAKVQARKKRRAEQDAEED